MRAVVGWRMKRAISLLRCGLTFLFFSVAVALCLAATNFLALVVRGEWSEWRALATYSALSVASFGIAVAVSPRD
jgi:hypothetical protein